MLASKHVIFFLPSIVVYKIEKERIELNKGNLGEI